MTTDTIPDGSAGMVVGHELGNRESKVPFR